MIPLFSRPMFSGKTTSSWYKVALDFVICYLEVAKYRPGLRQVFDCYRP